MKSKFCYNQFHLISILDSEDFISRSVSSGLFFAVIQFNSSVSRLSISFSELPFQRNSTWSSVLESIEFAFQLVFIHTLSSPSQVDH